MNIYGDWLVQPAKHGGNELYMPGRFVPCWDKLYGNNTEYLYQSRNGRLYRYVPDELKCQTFDANNGDYNQHRLDHYPGYVAYHRPIIQLSELSHFTDGYGFNMINNDRMIKAFPKFLHQNVTGPGKQQAFSFVWFTATVGDNGAEIVRNSILNRRGELCHFLPYDSDHQAQFNFMGERSNYATSAPFTYRDHFCGDKRFQFGIDQLLYNYCRLMDPYSSNYGYECRCMGTFIYQKEVMFAVLIHPPSHKLKPDERLFVQQFPALDKNGNDPSTVVFMDGGRFYWKPFSTSSSFQGVHKPVYCRWEQVAFAFYFPSHIKGIGV